MSGGEFVHLHCHSEYSLLDGACRFGQLAERVKELGMGSLALTDHGNLFGALQFQKSCDAAGIKPIIGCEVYVAPNGRGDRKTAEAKANQHFVLLAETDEGYANLARLTSLGFMEGFYYRPRIDKEILAEHAKGLIGLSACAKGVISDYLMKDNPAAAERALEDYVQILGRDNFYIEIMDHGLRIDGRINQEKINHGLLDLARRYDLPLVATNDCHYLTAEDHTTHDVLLCIQTGKTIDEEARMRYVNEFYMKTPEQMIGMFGHLNGAIKNTLAIAERCRGRIPTNQRLLPEYHPPNGETAEACLRRVTEEGLARRYNGRPEPIHRDRLEYELRVIGQMGFNSYFLVVWDFIAYARSQNIPVGPGRGSGAGSLVAYCLGITDLDPLQHGLFFERFLNPERVSMPDFDIDFCYERRGEVIEYVKRKYGERNVAQIITFSQMKAKAALHDVGRVMGMPLPEVDRVTKLVPDRPPEGEKKINLTIALKYVEDLRKIYDSEPRMKELIDHAMGVEGMVRHSSVHAAGVVISDRDLTRIIPLYQPPNTKDLVTQWTMGEVEEIGLLKMDFLGLKTLTFIDKTVKEVKRVHGVDVDWTQISIEDPATYELLQTGEALGLFQLESQGMRELLKQLRPESFAEVVALISLYRPGPMENIPEFIARKHGRSEIVYDHPALEPILKETYGLIVYQEQVMQIVQTLAGFSLGQADILRRAMGKKKAEEMTKLEGSFIAGCKSHKNVDSDLAVHMFKLIEKFAGYGFNKSHSAAYTMVTFQTSYLKAHYPVEFHAQLLTSEIGGSDDKMASYMAAAQARGIDVLTPNVNESRVAFAVAGKNIRFGLLAIKNVGEGAVEGLIAEREKNGPFKGLQDFVERMPPRMVNARALECMIKCGVFDDFGHNRPSMIKALPKVLERQGASRREASGAQTSMFDMMSQEDISAMNQAAVIDHVEDWPEAEKLEIEKNLAGYYLSGHPLRRYRDDIAAFTTATSETIKQMRKDEEVTWMGMIRTVSARAQKSDGRPFALVTAEDLQGSMDVSFFADAYAKYREYIQEGRIIWIKGTVNLWNDRVSLRALEAKTTDEIRAREIKGLTLTLPFGAVTEAALTQLSNIFSRHKGPRPVRLRLTDGNGHHVMIETGKGYGIRGSDKLIRELQGLKLEKTLEYILGG